MPTKSSRCSGSSASSAACRFSSPSARIRSSALAAGFYGPAVEATLYDRYGNHATQATLPVSVSIGNNPSGGMLSGTTTVNAVIGAAIYALAWGCAL